MTDAIDKIISRACRDIEQNLTHRRIEGYAVMGLIPVSDTDGRWEDLHSANIELRLQKKDVRTLVFLVYPQFSIAVYNPRAKGRFWERQWNTTIDDGYKLLEDLQYDVRLYNDATFDRIRDIVAGRVAPAGKTE